MCATRPGALLPSSPPSSPLREAPPESDVRTACKGLVESKCQCRSGSPSKETTTAHAHTSLCDKAEMARQKRAAGAVEEVPSGWRGEGRRARHNGEAAPVS